MTGLAVLTYVGVGFVVGVVVGIFIGAWATAAAVVANVGMRTAWQEYRQCVESRRATKEAFAALQTLLKSKGEPKE